MRTGRSRTKQEDGVEAGEREVAELTVEGTEEEEKEEEEKEKEEGRLDVAGDGEGNAEVSGAPVCRSGVFKPFVQHFIRVHIRRILSCDSFFLVIDFITSRLDSWCLKLLCIKFIALHIAGLRRWERGGQGDEAGGWGQGLGSGVDR